MRPPTFVCPSVLFLLAIVLFVLLCFTASGYLFGIFWPLYCLSFFALRLLVTGTSLVYFGHCIVCPSLLYGFWLPLWYLQTFSMTKTKNVSNMFHFYWTTDEQKRVPILKLKYLGFQMGRFENFGVRRERGGGVCQCIYIYDIYIAFKYG